MVLRHMDKRVLSKGTRQACDAESVQLTPEIKHLGRYRAANSLYPTATEPKPIGTATTIDRR